MIKSPSKYSSLAQLYTIRENGYRVASGEYEYCPEEVDSLIWEKETKRDELLYKEMMRLVESKGV